MTLDLYRGDQYQPSFRDRFPLHAVPAIEIAPEGGVPIDMTESGAIIVALTDAFPDKKLAPAAVPMSRARADYLQVIHTCGAAFDMMLWQIRIHEHILNDAQRDDRTIARYRHKFHRGGRAGVGAEANALSLHLWRGFPQPRIVWWGILCFGRALTAYARKKQLAPIWRESPNVPLFRKLLRTPRGSSHRRHTTLRWEGCSPVSHL